MKKCILTYDEWKSMKNKRRYGVDAHTSDFNGYIGLLSIDEVSEPQKWKYQNATITVLDNGYKWLSIMPDDDYYCITVMMDQNYRIVVSYIDMIDTQGVDEDGVPFFYDCYLDLIVYPDGNVIVDDRDELDEALKTNDISEEQYQRALSTAEKLQNGLLSDYKKYEVFIAKMLKITGSKQVAKNSNRVIL